MLKTLLNPKTWRHLLVLYLYAQSPSKLKHLQVFDTGAHCDVMNKQGLTAYTNCATGVAQTILKSTEKLRISLKCLCARSIKRHNLTYKRLEGPPILPIDLEEFVDIHAPWSLNNRTAFIVRTTICKRNLSVIGRTHKIYVKIHS